MADIKYIIVQAGGKGTRLETLTTNKPKALVPVDNLPMIFHLFKKYPGSKFIIIADYKKDVLKKYLHAFAKVDYEVIDAKGKGTCSGIKDSLTLIPDNTQFMLIWCDLVLSGHVHGGIMRLPFLGGVISPTLRLFPRYDGGLFREDGSTMILGRGLGSHTIPIRIFNPGELIVVDLEPQ